MKIRLILLEGQKEKIEALVKKYPKLKNLYEEGLISQMKPVFVEWIAKQNEPPEDVIGLIPAFIKNFQRLSKKDINQYTSTELSQELNDLGRSKYAPEEIETKETTILGQFGPWLVVMPHTTESSCYWANKGEDVGWCTARTTSQNLFLYYVARKDEDIVLYYILNNETNDDNSKISIGFVDGEPYLEGEEASLTVNKQNKGLNETALKNVLGEYYDQIMSTLQQHSDLISGKHPAKKEMEELAKNPVKLKKHLSKFKDENRLEEFINQTFQYNPSDRVLLMLANSENHFIKQQVARYKKTPIEVLMVLANDNSFVVKQLIATNINASVEILEKFANDNDKHVRAAVVSNEKCPVEIFNKLANDKEEYVRQQVADSSSCPVEILMHLANDKSEKVQKTVAQNRKTPSEALEIIFKNNSGNFNDFNILFVFSSNRKTPPEVLKMLFDYSNDYNNFKKYGYDPFKNDQTIKSQLASNSNSPPEVLEILAKHKNYNIREKVAANKNITSKIALILSNDTDLDVREQLALNKNISSEIIKILANDESQEVRDIISRRVEVKESKIKLKINLSKLI
jgi:hypothetical protein